MHKETRKIIKLGDSFGIIIPMPWIRYHKLDNRDQVELIFNDEIKIRPIKRNQEM